MFQSIRMYDLKHAYMLTFLGISPLNEGGENFGFANTTD